MTVVSATLFEEVQAGDHLPSLVKVPTTEQLVRYAGAANDYARIHYDDAHARERGFAGVIVHGLLKAAFLAQVVTRWCGPDAWVRDFSTQYRGVDRPVAPLVCRALVRDKTVEGDCGLVELDVWTENASGEVTTRGSATVVFPLGTETVGSATAVGAVAQHAEDSR